MAKVGVVLSGCGVFDGSEIHEAVITLLALDRAGAEVIMAAPDVELEVVDHYSGKASGEKRNVLVESARIARGKIIPLSELGADDIDALIFPGGFGAAKNLCDFAVKGTDATAIPEVARIVREVHKAGAALVGAPAIVGAVFEGGGFSPRITIGTDEETAAALGGMGAEHVSCPVEEFVVDEEQKLVTTPAYMLGEHVRDVATGIEKCVAEVLRMAGS